MPEYVQFLDTTLRDGNKLPFVVLSVRERLAIARQLLEIGVDVIDVGYPVSGEEEREAVSLIAREVKGPWISALARAVPEDVQAVCELLGQCERPYLHIFLPIAGVFLKNVLGRSPAECLRLIEQSLGAAKGSGLRVQFSLGEVGEADESFLVEAARAACASGAHVLNLADTNGCLHPEAAGALVRKVREGLKKHSNVLLGVHFHNDLGLATANTLFALQEGARHVEVTLGGIGGRSGNAALEEVAFGLEAFAGRLKLAHRLHLDKLAAASAHLTRLTGIPPHPNKPVLGRLALQETRGSDVRRALSEPLRELLQPKTIGRVEDVLFGDHEISQAGFAQHLESLGVEVEGVDLERVYRLFLSQVRRKRTVYLSEVEAMVEDARLEAKAPFQLVSFGVMTGSHSLPVGSVELRRGDEELVESSPGSGPVDALCRAVDKAAGLKPRLVQYAADTQTEGTEARAEVTLSLSFLGRVFHGRFGSTDVIEASLRAYLDAVNRIEAYRVEHPAAAEEFFIDGNQLWWE
jgi:2-isopropylmalate synthase